MLNAEGYALRCCDKGKWHRAPSGSHDFAQHLGQWLLVKWYGMQCRLAGLYEAPARPGLGKQRGLTALTNHIDTSGGSRHVPPGRREANLLVTNKQDHIVLNR